MEKNTLENSLKEFSQTSGTNANDVKEFFALMSDGSIKRMPKEDMATVLGGLIGVATQTKDGLLEAGKFGGVNDTYSTILIETKGNKQVTASLILSISAVTSGRPSLYYIAIYRSTGVTPPKVEVKLLSGSYSIQIVTKTDSDGSFRIYAKRVNYTPVLSATMYCNIGTSNLLMSKVNDESELDGSTEAALVE